LGGSDNADNSAGSDGKKGNDDDEGNAENVDHMDDNNPDRHNIAASVLVAFVNSFICSFRERTDIYYSRLECKTLVHINWAITPKTKHYKVFFISKQQSP
jgi:hypothetical protein